jgi:hypothetical protein
MRFAYCALRSVDVTETSPHGESGGYWIARSSRAMTVKWVMAAEPIDRSLDSGFAACAAPGNDDHALYRTIF